MAKTSDSVVRFIAYYMNGIEQSPTHILLGHGFEQVGESHRSLNMRFKKMVPEQPGRGIYAGYLQIVDDTISVYRGGSGTLIIPPNPDLDQRLHDDLNYLDYKKPIKNLFPLILGNLVPHAMIAD